MRLQGKTALITGSTSGIGAEVALQFAREGASAIVINGPPSVGQETVRDLSEKIQAAGARVTFIPADVSDENAVRDLVAGTLSFCEHLDILVNNAGIAHANMVEDLDIETWDRVMGVHLRGTFLVTHSVLPLMYKQGHGRIINTASQLAYLGAPGVSAYIAAKAGIIGFSRSLAREIGSRNVRVNCVAPGTTQTPILDSVPPDVLKQVTAAIPVGKLATPDQIAPAYVFLASKDGDHFQGQCISPNGGDVFL